MNYFKIKTYFLLFGVLSMGIFSCTNLQVEDVDSVISENEEGDFTGNGPELLNAVYQDLGAFTDQANIYSLGVHTSDEMIPPTRGVDWGDNGVWRTLHAHSWDPTHSYVLGAWNQLNERAFKCNQVIGSSAPAVSAQGVAEARFMRAFFMFHVMDYFGQVPFRGVNEGVDVDPKVFTRSEAFDFILADIEAALPNLPNTGPAADNSTATQAAANALLARMYLNKAVYKSASPAGPYTFDAGDMAKVVQAADAVTAAGYSYEANYFDNFTVNATSEIIFTSPAGTGQNRWMMTLHYSQNPSGWNGFTTLADFYAKFDANDQRIGNYPTPDGSEFSGIGRGFLIGQQYNDDGSQTIDSRSQQPLVFTEDVPLAGAATPKGIRAIKYHPSDAGKYILFRYGDVMTMKAEALMRSGSTNEALAVLNDLRAARGASQLTKLDEPTMLDERGREMYWEGVRRTDQIRFGTFTDTWSEKTSTESHRVLFPIPQQALDSNPNLTQNEGY